MRIFTENGNRDLAIGANNQLGILSGIEAVSQACKSAVEAQRGEMQYDINRGVPTKETVWTGVPNKSRYEFYAVQTLNAVAGVISVLRFDSDILDNVLTYQATIKTEFGDVVIGSAVPEES